MTFELCDGAIPLEMSRSYCGADSGRAHWENDTGATRSAVVGLFTGPTVKPYSRSVG